MNQPRCFGGFGFINQHRHFSRPMWRTMCVVAVLLTPCYAAPLYAGLSWTATAVAAQDNLSVEQANAALEIALATAMALRQPVQATETEQTATEQDFKKLQQLSTNAVARALQFGPPNRSEAAASSPLIFRSVVVDINQKISKPTVETFRQGLPSRLLRLSDEWRLRQIDPQLAYDALQVCVNPPSRPDRLFLYAKETTNSQFPSFSIPKSVAHELIWWAVKANRIGDLEQSLKEQQLDAVAEGCFLFLLLAIEAEDEAAIRQRCQQLQNFVQRASDPQLLRLLAVCLMKARRSIRQLPEAAALLQRTGETLLAVDGQSVAQANFAATAAVDGFRVTVSQALRRDDSAQKDAGLADLANRLLQNHRLLEPLGSELRAAIADEILTSGFTKMTLTDPVKSAVAERQLRFPKNRHLVPLVNANQAAVRVPKTVISVDWNPGPSPDSAAIWIQQQDIGDLSRGNTQTILTISGLVSVGSPSTNVDGSILAFHGRTAGSAMGSGNHVYVIDRIRKTMTDIGLAVNPSLTASGRRLTCSRYTPNKGTWLVRSDGSNWRLLDESGWASKFSPDGNEVAYTVPLQGRTAIIVYDLVSHCRRPEHVSHYNVLTVDDQVAAFTGWPFCWAKSDAASHGSSFWLLNRKDQQLLKYPIYRWWMDKYLANKRIFDVVNVVQDLNSLTDDQLIWLGPVRSINSELALWKTGQKTPFTIDDRRLLGATAWGPNQVILFSKAKPKGD